MALLVSAALLADQISAVFICVLPYLEKIVSIPGRVLCCAKIEIGSAAVS